jgi:hypothetical protein
LKNGPKYQAQRLITYFIKPAGRVSVSFLFDWLGDSNRSQCELDGLRQIISGYYPIELQDMKMVSNDRLSG